MMKINRIIWKETFVKKIENKHHVTMFEVEEILHGKRKVRIYQLAKKQAEAKHSTVEQIINTLLDQELVRTE